MGNFKEDIARVEAFVFDIDGVFTDGTYALKQGYKIFVITGGRGRTLESRFRYLGVTEFHSHVSDKIAVLHDICERHGLNPDNVIFMGDDIPDVECMRAVGIPVCPADAASEAIEASRYVSEFGGGKGCVRDIIEQTLRAQGRWGLSLKGIHDGITTN